MKNNIDIHADDYAYSLNTSKDIIECIKSGNLDSFSIIPNMGCFEDCMELLYKEIPSFKRLPRISVHLNIVEGFNLTNTNLLCKDGVNNATWGSLLLASVSGLRKDLKEQLKLEIKEQLLKVDEVITRCVEIAKDNKVEVSQKGMRIDSHVHTHAIPIVFDALIEVIKEEKLNIEYIRNPKEPIIPFIRNINLGFKPVNFIKNLILNVFSFKIDAYINKKKLQKEYMWGLMMSLEMDYPRIEKIYTAMVNYAKRKNRDLEILFHPGIALSSEESIEENKEYFVNSNLSKNREVEKEAVMSMNSLLKR